MSQVMEQLELEHRNVAKLLDLLERELGKIREATSADFELVHDVMHYMTHYADDTHHPKEDLMFRRLQARAPAEGADVIERLGREHRALAEKGAAFLEQVSQVVDGGMVLRTDIEAAGNDYAAFMRAHMAFEDGEAFPLAVRLLADEDWDAVEKAFAASQDPVFGPIRRDDYARLLAHIEQQS